MCCFSLSLLKVSSLKSDRLRGRPAKSQTAKTQPVQAQAGCNTCARYPDNGPFPAASGILTNPAPDNRQQKLPRCFVHQPAHRQPATDPDECAAATDHPDASQPHYVQTHNAKS